MPQVKRASYLAVLLVMMLSGTACSPTSETVTTTAQLETDTILTESSSTPAVEPSSLLPNTGQLPTDQDHADQDATDQELTDTERYVYDYPDFFLTNSNDLSTPLGTLCWAIWEYLIMELLQLHEILIENTPGLAEVYSDVGGINDGEVDAIAPVGVVSEEIEEPARGTDDYTYLDALVEIQKPGIVGIVNDSELSEELQLYAQTFFALISAIEIQVRAVGYQNIDYTQLPYQDLEDLPHVQEFDKAATDHPEECVVPSEREIEAWYENLEAENWGD